MKLNLQVLKDKYSIFRFDKNSTIPDWATKSDFYSITKTHDELSIVCIQPDMDLQQYTVNTEWKAFKINQLLDLSLVGILAGLLGVLKESKISIFTISTYDTDYILVKSQNLEKATQVLKAQGHKVTYE